MQAKIARAVLIFSLISELSTSREYYNSSSVHKSHLKKKKQTSITVTSCGDFFVLFFLEEL